MTDSSFAILGHVHEMLRRDEQWREDQALRTLLWASTWNAESLDDARALWKEPFDRINSLVRECWPHEATSEHCGRLLEVLDDLWPPKDKGS